MKQRRIFKYKFLVFILGGGILFLLLLCSQKQPMEPEKPCINDQPVEDTTRVYLRPISRDTLYLFPDRLYVRFYPWVSDTNKILQLLEKYQLQRVYNYFTHGFENHIAAELKITKNRAEYYFTPYGKEGFCNFGTDSLVEYSFGIFYSHIRLTPTGEIEFKFPESISESQIDSFFNAHGLRFLYTLPDYPSGIRYTALITPKAQKNVLDLGYDLQSDPLIDICSVLMATPMLPPNK